MQKHLYNVFHKKELVGEIHSDSDVEEGFILKPEWNKFEIIGTLQDLKEYMIGVFDEKIKINPLKKVKAHP